MYYLISASDADVLYFVMFLSHPLGSPVVSEDRYFREPVPHTCFDNLARRVVSNVEFLPKYNLFLFYPHFCLLTCNCFTIV